MKKITIEGWIAIWSAIFAAFIAIFVQEIHDYLKANFMIYVFILLVSVAIVFAAIAFINGRYRKLKHKITALKQFRDKEMIRIINHYNAQLHTLEQRVNIINKDNKFFEFANYDDPNVEKNFLENEKQKEKEIIEYNKAFSDWELERYGFENFSSIYKNKDDFIK